MSNENSQIQLQLLVKHFSTQIFQTYLSMSRQQLGSCNHLLLDFSKSKCCLILKNTKIDIFLQNTYVFKVSGHLLNQGQKSTNTLLHKSLHTQFIMGNNVHNKPMFTT